MNPKTVVIWLMALTTLEELFCRHVSFVLDRMAMPNTH